MTSCIGYQIKKLIIDDQKKKLTSQTGLRLVVPLLSLDHIAVEYRTRTTGRELGKTFCPARHSKLIDGIQTYNLHVPVRDGIVTEYRTLVVSH